MRDGLRNNEVEQPLSGSRERNVHGSQSRGRDLGDDNPAARTPAKLEESREEEDAGEGEVADRWDRFPCDWGIEAYIEANHEHGAPLGDGSPEE